MNTQTRTFILSLLLFLGISVAFANTDTRSVDTEVVISASPEKVMLCGVGPLQPTERSCFAGSDLYNQLKVL